jgi:hypothetical protein
MVLETASCAHCAGTPIASCDHCLAPICKSHVLICPICHGRFCHTDAISKGCFRDHLCRSPR